MFQSITQRFWLRSLLILLVLLSAAGTTTFIAMHQKGAQAAGTPNSSFSITNGDTYTFTDNTPGSFDGATVNFGNWTVTDTTTNTNLGQLSGTTKASVSPNGKITNFLTLTAPIIAPSGVNGSAGTTAYQQYPNFGSGTTLLSSEGAFGEILVQGCADPLAPTVCGPYLFAPNEDPNASNDAGMVLLQANDPAYQAVQQAITSEDSGISALEQIASIKPSQVMARTHGGGPLAVSQSQRPALAPLATFLIGVTVAVTGLVVSNVCTIASCSDKAKGALAIVGGIMTLVGGYMTGASGYLGVASRAASAGQVAQGFEMTSAAVAENTAMTTAQLTSIQQSLANLSAAGMTAAGA